jgi:uncharacterized protein (TIGR00297 family)
MGGFVLFIGYLPTYYFIGLCIFGLVFNIWFLDRITKQTLKYQDEKHQRYSIGLISYPATLLALALLFQSTIIIFGLCWIILSLGDGSAGILGSLSNGKPLPWNPDKSWVGLAAFWVFGIAGCQIFIIYVPDFILGTLSTKEWQIISTAVVLISGVAETIPDTLDDNIFVTLVSAVGFWFLLQIFKTDFVPSQDLIFVDLGIASILGVLAYIFGRMNISGAISGTIVAAFTLIAFELKGLIILGLFVVVGIAASKLKKDIRTLGENRGHRNVLGNGMTSLVLAFFSIFLPGFHDMFFVLFSCTMASALSDTLSSELGTRYGRRFFNITTGEPGPKGDDGVISYEGLLFGVMGSLIIATAYFIISENIIESSIIFFAGMAGNIADSLLGSSAQKMRLLNNHTVNFYNTLVAVFVGLSLVSILQIN